MGQDFRLLAPVRGLTRPPIPHPFHGLWQNCPETFLHEDIDFFFSKVWWAGQEQREYELVEQLPDYRMACFRQLSDEI